jgi:hypothetical protein
MLIPSVPKPRSFNYQPQYYDPSAEEEKRIHFRRIRHSESPRSGSLLRLLILTGLLIMAIFYLSRATHKTSATPDAPAGQIQVEDIIVVD